MVEACFGNLFEVVFDDPIIPVCLEGLGGGFFAEGLGIGVFIDDLFAVVEQRGRYPWL